MCYDCQISNRAKFVKLPKVENLPVEHDIVREKTGQQTLNYTYRKPKHQEDNGAKHNLQGETGCDTVANHSPERQAASWTNAANSHSRPRLCHPGLRVFTRHNKLGSLRVKNSYPGRLPPSLSRTRGLKQEPQKIIPAWYGRRELETQNGRSEPPATYQTTCNYYKTWLT